MVLQWGIHCSYVTGFFENDGKVTKQLLLNYRVEKKRDF